MSVGESIVLFEQAASNVRSTTYGEQYTLARHYVNRIDDWARIHIIEM